MFVKRKRFAKTPGFLALGLVLALLAACAGPSGSPDGSIPEIGVLDPGFGQDYDGDGTPDGWVFASLPGGHARPEAAKLDGDGRIVVVGSSFLDTDGGWRMTLWRFTPAGAPDLTFGQDYDGDGTPDGYVRFAHPDVSESGGLDLAITGSRIYVTGYLVRSTGTDGMDLAVWSYKLDGSPDPYFHFPVPVLSEGRNFVYAHDAAGGGRAEAGQAILVDGNDIYVAGYSEDPSFKNAMVVWNLTKEDIFINPITYQHWVTDATFATGGFLVDRPGDGDAAGNGIAYNYGFGGFYVVGKATGPSGTDDLAVWRVKPSGELASDFPGPGLQEAFLHHDAAGGGAGDVGYAASKAGSSYLLVAGASVAGPATATGVVWRLGSEGGVYQPLSGPPAADPHAFGDGGQGWTLLGDPDAGVQVANVLAYDGNQGFIFVGGYRGLLAAEAVFWALDPNGKLARRSAFSQGDFLYAFPEALLRDNDSGTLTAVLRVARASGGQEGLVLLRYR
ncbi:delta-60 repeat domain-containing protein [Oceanithermus sp.]|uniref:delta-60 repeat domain-containing protein n=1 Tax=Oceanithermus sp. TaxID=2268145 RepID=UPI00257ED537|nr:delta-60 repeat domain-containing protein [Oceanithermus sp.]